MQIEYKNNFFNKNCFFFIERGGDLSQSQIFDQLFKHYYKVIFEHTIELIFLITEMNLATKKKSLLTTKRKEIGTIFS